MKPIWAHVGEIAVWMIWWSVANNADSAGALLKIILLVPVIAVAINVFTEGTWTEKASRAAWKVCRRKVAATRAAASATAKERNAARRAARVRGAAIEANLAGHTSTQEVAEEAPRAAAPSTTPKWEPYSMN